MRTGTNAAGCFKRFYTYLSQDISRNSNERNEFDELKKFLLEWYRLFLTVKGVKSEDIKKITQLEEFCFYPKIEPVGWEKETRNRRTNNLLFPV